ncbi:hypothetical protein CfE428DRAFT_6077 [Chthoniobacter flavus Ellin428]|uniref:DUF6576 domain-containing protein n=1 Tax=Chthoniobacter flavus Ellin428 TaxID=497964 RepID=B4DAY6_9BACT|nr:DUF6576 domain-containing protein [Chthoniobacter flavus]EDY16360.1 hypothetical protein CfE428DRAFT_6077 [Chthoniobacter flavus Ellin428]TCO92448.1 hypothetical protein EV701_106217 [Chthoniobacter flavus]
MARYNSSPTLPLGQWNNFPIYLTTILSAAMGLGLIGTAIMNATAPQFLRLFVFAMPLDPPWWIWRAITYVLISPVSFFSPFAILFFYWVAVGIETHLGRVVLTRLLVLLALTPPAVAAVWWWGFGHSSLLDGYYMLIGGLIVAFATLYPNADAWSWIPFKWLAFACIACGTFMMLGEKHWFEIAQLWSSCIVGFLYIRQAKAVEYDDYESPIRRLKQFFRRKPKLRVLPSPRTSAYRAAAAVNEPDSELDTLLDKIAKSGIDSLTPKEKASLQKAREALIRKDQH